ncbi:MAG: GH116 family glycosyl-hydrolase, partial [Caldilineaceae bacterium]
RGAKTSQISFPLGGIGSGSIGLAGNGRLIDWEIYNRPNKGSVNGFSHFAVRAENESGVIGARVLHSDLLPPYQGELQGPSFNSFGWGPRREYLTGLPHFPSSTFSGEFPIAKIDFEDESFPAAVSLQAFNPFIPTNDKDSSIPAALFEISLTNTSEDALTYTVVGVLGNPLPPNNIHSVELTDWGHALHIASDSLDAGAVNYGEMTLATDAGKENDVQVSWQRYWFKGAWFDNLEVYWHDLNIAGPFQDRSYPPQQAINRNDGLLAVHVPIKGGSTRRVRFVISWNFPNCENYWNAQAEGGWRNYYATVWENSTASARYALTEWPRLYAETLRFKEALFASDLPPAAIDAVSANISILKSPTVLRLEDGTFYGWEGCHPSAGCCEGTCTHVWNYAQALPFLFPKLERSVRDADYAYNLRPDGGMPFRLQLPIGSAPWGFRPCADGQFGGVLKTYRDWKVCGDTEWLRGLWPAVKQSIEFAWSPKNIDRWDPDKSGVLTGRQHHTLDMELFGPNSWLTGMYLGALKAGAEMARHLGDEDAADEYGTVFERGKVWADEHLFNGEYYYQQIDLSDKGIVESYEDDLVIQGGSALQAYWTEEHKEIKYQIAEGSSIDQVLAQWHASLYGLGEIFDPDQVRQACAAIYKYNYVPIMRDAYNPDRIYCLNDESGLVICAWPEGARKPVIPAPYSQETMNGFEYSAAIHMIMNGLVDEGMECVAAIRRRYDGERRNPWNEFECGSNYARSMASYALLNAFSGFEFDMVQRMVGFDPVRTRDGRFNCFWSLDSGLGQFRMGPGRTELRVMYGRLEIQSLRLPFLDADDIRSVTVDGEPVGYGFADGVLSLDSIAEVAAESIVRVDSIPR